MAVVPYRSDPWNADSVKSSAMVNNLPAAESMAVTHEIPTDRALDGRIIESTTTETVVPHRVRDLEGK
jgi:hypothetical protein